MLDLDRLRRMQWASSPFRWGVDDRLLEPAAVAELVRTFPDAGFTDVERATGSAGHDKPYRMRVCPLIEQGTWVGTGLAAPWVELGAGLCSRAYVDALATSAGLEPDGLVVDANLWRYGAGSWLGPHPDKPTKLVSHVVYLSAVWDEAWGGGLRILRSGADHDIEAEVAPAPGRSVLIVTSPTSWHAVAPVVGDPGVERCSLTVNLVRRDP